MPNRRSSDGDNGGQNLDYIGSRPNRGLDLMFGLGLIVPAGVGFVATKFALRGTGEDVLFVQKRVGKAGVLFPMYKWHTIDQPTNRYLFAAAKKYREIRLDETPQVINIFRGEMGAFGHRGRKQGEREEIMDNLIGYSDLQTGYDDMIMYEPPGCIDPGTIERLATGRTDQDNTPGRIAQEVEFFRNRSFTNDLKTAKDFVNVVIAKAIGSVDIPAGNP